MGWLKVDDKMPRNPKILAGDIETAWYYACALTHAAEQLTDGFIARSAVPLVAPHITDPCSVAERCADLELFRRLEDGYLIPDYLEFNPSRESVVQKRAEDAERQRKKRERDASRGESQRDSQQTSGVNPDVPSRPVPGTSTPHPPTDTAGIVEAVTTRVVEQRLEAQRSVRNPVAWKRTARANLTAEEHAEIARVCEKWPGAPITMLAAAADGDLSPHLNNYRPQETA